MSIRSKITIILFLALTLTAGPALSRDKIAIMDIINEAPKCYVIEEMLSLYSKSRDKSMDVFYVNYSNSARFLFQGKDEMNTIPLMFNQQAEKTRKIFLQRIIGIGFDKKIYSDIYVEFSCDNYSTPINISDVDTK